MADVQNVELEINKAIADLGHRHATVSYFLIAMLAFVLVLAGVGGYVALRFANAQISRAEAAEARYDADRKQFTDQTAADAAARAADSAKQQIIVKVVHDRDTAANQAVQNALKPDMTLPDIEKGLRTAYSGVPGFEAPLPLNGVYISVLGQQAQQITAYKIEHDKLKLDLADTQNVLKLEQDKNSSLTSDLGGCKTLNTEANQTIVAYKRAARSSRFKKVLHGTGVAVAIIAAAYLGHKL